VGGGAPHQLHRIPPVGGLTQHSKAAGLQQQPQPGPDQMLVVGDHHGGRHEFMGSGRVAVSSNTPSAPDPYESVPPKTAPRSRIPTRPSPPAGSASPTRSGAVSAWFLAAINNAVGLRLTVSSIA